jgi:hypothetical protein
VLRCARDTRRNQGKASALFLRTRNERRNNMPILLWFLGVPISLILVLMLFGAF